MSHYWVPSCTEGGFFLEDKANYPLPVLKMGDLFFFEAGIGENGMEMKAHTTKISYPTSSSLEGVAFFTRVYAYID